MRNLNVAYEEHVALDRLDPFDGNPNMGDDGAVAEMIETNGWYGVIVAEIDGDPKAFQPGKTRGRIVAGHTRDRTLASFGEAVPAVQWIVTDGDDHARRILMGDNRSTRLGYDDPRLAIDLLEALAVTEAGLRGTGWDGDDLDALLAEQRAAEQSIELTEMRSTEPKPSKRSTRLDAIFTMNNRSTHALIAIARQAGMLHGIQSNRSVMRDGFFDEADKIAFIDNEFKNYDHEMHRDCVALFRPKYATVRDLMSKGQCKDADIYYYEFDQIMEWAEELEQHAENVIVIPKYDCIDKIPERFVLGYSIVSQYAGTPLAAEAFRGRRVHLLGGRWGDQLRYLEMLGDDVVAFDNNSIFKGAMWGSYVLQDGRSGDTYDLNIDVSNPFTVAMAISVGHIMRKCIEIAPDDDRSMDPEPIEEPIALRSEE